MTVEILLGLLLTLSTITSLCTEAVKKFLNAQKMNYASNVVVLVVSLFVGGTGAIVFYMYKDIAWTTLNIINIFIIVIANWLVAMVGYDKVKQVILQIKCK